MGHSGIHQMCKIKLTKLRAWPNYLTVEVLSGAELSKIASGSFIVREVIHNDQLDMGGIDRAHDAGDAFLKQVPAVLGGYNNCDRVFSESSGDHRSW